MKTKIKTIPCVAIACMSVATSWDSGALAQGNSGKSLGKSLSFHASFDSSPDADFARGDRGIWQAVSINKRDEATKGLPGGGEVKLDPLAGRFGGAIRFGKSKGPIVFFKAEDNFTMPTLNWSGTVCFWLKTDFATDLLDGFCDPIQITSKQWDDASLFVEFEKRATGIPFRLGVYADKSVWNPTGRNFADIPPVERPLVTVEKSPFASGNWTHVAFAFEKFNSGKQDGHASLYLDGKKMGEIGARTQTFTWEPKRASIMLGLSYVGMMDDLALFDRALTQEEVSDLFALKSGIGELLPK